MLDIHMFQLVLDCVFNPVLRFHVGVAGHDNMGRHGILRRADGPNMEVVDVNDAFYLLDFSHNFVEFDASGHSIEGER